jgi:L-gulono-1,4-lactone dehydrogenase
VRRVRPESADEVVQLVRSARDQGLRVKAIGTGHSFSGIAVAPGIQLDMSALTGVRSVGIPGAGAGAGAGARETGDRGIDGTDVTLGAGTVLHDLPSMLDPLGLALQNMGDIDVQTLAGATSTGTHGTGARFGGLATRITGATLVTADGELLTVNASENADLLPAVALGLGSLGILVDLTVNCVPAFKLHSVERREPLAEVLGGWRQRIADSDHFEFYYFPHTEIALTKTNNRVAVDAPGAALGSLQRWWEDDALPNRYYAASCGFQRMVPGTTPAINRFSVKVTGAREFTDHSHRVFSVPRRVRFREMEYAIPQDQIPQALAEVKALIDRKGWRISFPIEVRAAAADNLWLSTASGRATGYIAVHRYYREDPTEYFAGVEEILKAHDGRPHWGKMSTRTTRDLAPAYPHFDEFLAVRDRLDPDRMFTNDYLDRMLGS